ncbi:hypothetical protein ABEY65_28160 [Priestia aryabhattai]|uniref:hypothetical protein n=1 Tax=Priestia aryabhattai TaxID=412384 RepID=UPI003D281773
MTKFKVGDIVKGNNPSRYGITDDCMTKGEVVEVYSNGDIDVRLIEHSKGIMLGETFPRLEPEYFDLVKPASFKVGDIVKGTKGSPYFVTSDKMRRGEVTHIHHDGDISVRVLEHDNSTDVGDTYPVKPEYFVLVEEGKDHKIEALEKKVAELEKKVEELEAEKFAREIGLELVPSSVPVPVVIDRTFKAELGEGCSFEGTQEDFKGFLGLMEEYIKRTESNKTYRF